MIKGRLFQQKENNFNWDNSWMLLLLVLFCDTYSSVWSLGYCECDIMKKSWHGKGYHHHSLLLHFNCQSDNMHTHTHRHRHTHTIIHRQGNRHTHRHRHTHSHTHTHTHYISCFIVCLCNWDIIDTSLLCTHRVSPKVVSLVSDIYKCMCLAFDLIIGKHDYMKILFAIRYSFITLMDLLGWYHVHLLLIHHRDCS